MVYFGTSLLLFCVFLCPIAAQDNSAPLTDASLTTEAPPITEAPSTTEAPTTLEPIPEVTIGVNSYSWSSTETSSLIVRVDEGYMISVTVSDVNIDGAQKDYLLIVGGETFNDKATDGRVFTYTVTKPQRYLYQNTAVFAYYLHNAAGSADKPFKVVFDRVGEIVTTTSVQPTISTVPWPTAPPDEYMFALVNVSGVNFEQYANDKVLDDFRACVKDMAVAYCHVHDIKLNQEITETNVMVTEVNRCPYAWPGSEKCVQIRFKLPIFYESSTWTGYQLSSSHLELMWTRYSETCAKYGFSKYNEPDVDNIVMWWAIGITCVTICFIIFLWLLRMLAIKFSSTMRKRRMSDTVSIVSSRRDRDSNISLTPHYLQETPKLFENEYPMVDPNLH